MALFKSSNAEIGIYSAEGWTRLTANNEVVRDNSITPHGGSWSWITAGDGISKNCWLSWTSVGSLHWWIVRMWLRVGNLPTVAEQLHPATSGGATAFAFLRINPDGTLGTPTGIANGYPIASSPALIVGNWYKLEIALIQHGSSQAWANLIYRLNDVEFARFCGRPNFGAFTRLQTTGGTSLVARQNVDDIVINDDTGTTGIYWNDANKPRSAGKVTPSVRSMATPVIGSAISTNIVVNKPSSVVAGDLLVAIVQDNQSSVTITGLPTGWSLIVNIAAGVGGGIGLAYKWATNSEPSNYTFVVSPSSRSIGLCYALTSVDPVNPIIDAKNVSVTTFSLTFAAFPALDLSEGDTLIMQAVANTSTSVTVTPPAWWSSISGAKDATNGQEARAGVYTSTDGGLSASDLVTFSGNTSSNALATVAFRGVLPTKNKFEMVV